MKQRQLVWWQEATIALCMLFGALLDLRPSPRIRMRIRDRRPS